MENQGEFKHDSEFIMQIKSPTKFSDNSSEDDTGDETGGLSSSVTTKGFGLALKKLES